MIFDKNIEDTLTKTVHCYIYSGTYFDTYIIFFFALFEYFSRFLNETIFNSFIHAKYNFLKKQFTLKIYYQ